MFVKETRFRMKTSGESCGAREVADPLKSRSLEGSRSADPDVADRVRSGARTVNGRYGQPQTPPCFEQHPCLFAQLVHVGESVPSQHRREPLGGGGGGGVDELTVIDVLRWIAPQLWPFAVSVIVSVPARLPA